MIESIQQRLYETILYFLSTDGVAINKSRVRRRSIEGGHDVAFPIIEQRHRMDISYLSPKILNVKEAYLIDCSFEIPKQITVVENGQVLQTIDVVPVWTKEVLFIAYPDCFDLT